MTMPYFEEGLKLLKHVPNIMDLKFQLRVCVDNHKKEQEILDDTMKKIARAKWTLHKLIDCKMRVNERQLINV